MYRIVIVYQNHKRSRPCLEYAEYANPVSPQRNMSPTTHINKHFILNFFRVHKFTGQTISQICVHQTSECYVLPSMAFVNHKAIDLFNNPVYLFYFHILALRYIFTFLLYKFTLTVFLVFAFLTFRTCNRIPCTPRGSDYDQNVQRYE